MLIDELIEELMKAKEAAMMTRASFGFPDDRLEIKAVHFGDDDRGHVGDILHPDDYIKRTTKLFRETWIIPQINHVIELLGTHANAINDLGRLVDATAGLEVEVLASQLEALTRRLRAGLEI